MKKLEVQLGTGRLAARRRSLRLTQAGQYLLAVANRVLLDLAEYRPIRAGADAARCASA